MKTILALLLAFVASTAQAGVVYQWQLNSASPNLPREFSLEIEFSNTAVLSGQVNYDFNCVQTGEMSCAPDRHSPILRLDFYLSGADPINFAPRKQGLHLDGTLSVEVNFLPSGILTGRIYANNTNTHLDMSSTGLLFTVNDTNSDAYESGCLAPSTLGGDSACFGATGVILAVPNQVPEPSTIALAGLALSGLWFARRRPSRK